MGSHSVVTAASSTRALNTLPQKQGVAMGAMVGNTKVEKGMVGSWCNGRLVTADVGMSRYIEDGGCAAYVTVDPLTRAWRRRKVTMAARIHAHYPLGKGTRVWLNTTTTTKKEHIDRTEKIKKERQTGNRRS